ncbi:MULTISPECIES: hypothetical protein [Bradyrhizobium]|uniref:hypothetical protein n=1 Tax=Bradyrhizobium elkanii TaxID=29448 RepID=UPI0027144BBB|nr:hypothetical protein [Bradyrhizobium elkanii]WLA50112.1 hypothetical protein QIH80_08035 [Bradyrhizobium elkanii]WLB79657.1 hypothetical protein QIH83_35950 [Bradyrhizobium elkanii]
MKRSSQLPSAQAAILNAPPLPRQADRLAAPLRRRGAWTQFVEARLREPANPERDPAGPPDSPTDEHPTVLGEDPSSPKGGPTDEAHPLLDLEQPLQPIVLPQDEVSRRLNEAAENIGRRTNVTRPDAGSDDRSVSPAADPNDVSAEESDNRLQPAPPDSHAGSAVALYATEADEGEGFSPAADPGPNSVPPASIRLAVQPPVHISTAEASVAVQEQQTILIEKLIAEELQSSPRDRRSVTSEWKVRNFVWFLAPTTVLLAIGTGMLMRGNVASLFSTAPQVVSHSNATPVQPPPQSRRKLKPAIATFVHRAPIEAAAPAPPARSLPTTYGIFASSNGRMIRLEPMNIRLPDSRIAVSVLTTKPGTVVVPHGPLSFVAYQRELMTSAPDNAQLRILAQVARTPSSPAVAMANDAWAIRSVSVDLTVAPVPENREMVELQPVNPDLVLSPGRYVLVFKSQAYDFVVAGKVTDKAHCLERAETPDGDRFTECRKLP